MLDQIIGFAIRNKLLIGLFIVALVGYGKVTNLQGYLSMRYQTSPITRCR